MTRSTTGNSRGVLVVGLDAATFDVITPLTRAGKLPVLSKFMNEGAFGKLRSTIPPLTPPAWTSMVTGRNPGKHGIYDFIQREPNSYKHKLITSSDRQCPAVWNILSRRNKRVCVINVPMTYPPETVNGCMISGLGTPESRRDFCYPNGLLEEIEKAVGTYRIWFRSYPHKDEPEEFLADIGDLVESQTRAATYLLGKEKWDFFMIVFQVADWAQHYYWKYVDESHSFLGKASSVHSQVIERAYCKLDSMVGDLLHVADPEMDVIIVSDHGMGPSAKNVYMNNWLASKGYLRYKRSLRYALFQLGFTSELVFRATMGMRLGRLIARVRESKASLLKLFLTSDDINWSKTMAYSYGNDGKMLLNLRGREPDGIVEQGQQFLKIRDQIIDELKRFVDPETEEHVCDAVYKGEEVFFGPYASHGADIIPLMSRYHQDFHFVSRKIFGQSPDNVSANHRLHGVFLIKGENIRRGTGPDVSILDIAPTVLYLMQESIPRDFDGSVIASAFQEGLLEKTPPRYEEVADVRQNEPQASLTDRDEALVRARLRSLGYMD